jgi:hypothetical protein
VCNGHNLTVRGSGRDKRSVGGSLRLLLLLILGRGLSLNHEESVSMYMHTQSYGTEHDLDNI